MQVLLGWLSRTFAPIVKWVGVNVIFPFLISKLKALFDYFKKKVEHSKRVANAKKRNDAYENNPSDDTFGSSP